MSRTRELWTRLKHEIRVATAAWLVAKAQQLTPDADYRTHAAFYFLMWAMMADDQGTKRCRAWTSSTNSEAR